MSDKIEFKKAGSYSFLEIEVYPPQSERFFQLIRDGNPMPYVFSESHLIRCLHALKDVSNGD